MLRSAFRVSSLSVVAALLAFTPIAGAATLQTLHGFDGGTEGSAPEGQLVTDSAGLLYGTTITGGPNSGGTVFRFDPGTSMLTVLYAFTIGGATGTTPAAGLILHGGMLYGTTQRGGGSANCAYGCGTVFKLDPATGKLKVLHAFDGPGDGSTPSGRLLFDSTGKIVFGTTLYGGNPPACGGNGCGVVFAITLATKAYAPMHVFSGTDGAAPSAGLTYDKTGILYGTASAAGANGSGVLFKIDPVTSAYSVLHDFDNQVDGSGPRSDLTFKGGLFWGTTVGGGAAPGSSGTIFTYDPVGGIFTSVHDFVGADGIFPYAAPVAGPNGLLYGTANQGGTTGSGTIYSIKPTTLAFKVLYNFTGGADGALPQAGLLKDGTVAHYGVTSYGNGTIYKITP